MKLLRYGHPVGPLFDLLGDGEDDMTYALDQECDGFAWFSRRREGLRIHRDDPLRPPRYTPLYEEWFVLLRAVLLRAESNEQAYALGGSID